MVSEVVRRLESVRASSKPPNTKATPTITPKTPVNVPLSVRNKSPMDRPSTASGLMPTRLPEKKASDSMVQAHVDEHYYLLLMRLQIDLVSLPESVCMEMIWIYSICDACNEAFFRHFMKGADPTAVITTYPTTAALRSIA